MPVDFFALIELLLFALLLGFWLFFFLHAMQYTESVQERSTWFLFFVLLHFFTALYYFLTEYQTHRKNKKGKLMRFSKSAE